jgi:hypothetical protein
LLRDYDLGELLRLPIGEVEIDPELAALQEGIDGSEVLILPE